jgi:cellobiose phosphorylase
LGKGVGQLVRLVSVQVLQGTRYHWWHPLGTNDTAGFCDRYVL